MHRSTWPVYWPWVVLVAGYPLWWLLGVASLLPVVLAIPLAVQLARRRSVRLPSGAFWWALYLIWVVLGAAALAADSPSGVPGGTMNRIPVYLIRLVWFCASTVVLLWAYNLDEDELPTRRIVRIAGWMFVITTAGGLLGVVAPRLQLTTALQMVLPRGLLSIHYVENLVTAPVASIQSVLGVEGGRPVAPFAFANSWGANLSMFLPFFLVGFCGRDSGWKRWPAMLVPAVAIIPVIVSLNRGLWISLLVGIVYLLVRTALRGGAAMGLLGVAVVVALAVPLVGSDLGGIVESRIQNPHSNERRGELLQTTVSDTALSSPVIGFGSTRDVRGSFASIAGGGTPECPACEVPPLGTQGQLWFVVFATGLVGAAFFLLFFGNQLRRHWRSRTAVEAIGVSVLLFFLVQLLVYDTMDLPMMTVMLAIGLMERRHPPARSSTLAGWSKWLRSRWLLICVPAVLGALIGAGLALQRPTVYAATTSIELQPVPMHLDVTEVDSDARSTTVDTEAAMVFSERALSAVADQLDGRRPDRSDIEVTAAPTTRVMFLTVHDPDPTRAAQMSDALTAAYLDVRRDYLEQRRDQVLADLDRQLEEVAGTGRKVEIDVDGTTSTVREEDLLLDQLRSTMLTGTVPGEVLRSAEVSKVRVPIELWIASGIGLGLLVGLVLGVFRDPSRSRRRRRS